MNNDNSLAKRLQANEIILIALIALSAIGIAVTDFSPKYGFWYWMAMVPIFGGFSLYTGWSRATSQGISASAVIRTQLLHWIGLLIAIVLVFFLLRTGRINNIEAGIVALLMFAFATFLAGVHFDWRYMVVGIILGAAVVGAALVQEFIWMIMIPIVAAIILAIIWWWRTKDRVEEI
jgi:hypothetical protein